MHNVYLIALICRSLSSTRLYEAQSAQCAFLQLLFQLRWSPGPVDEDVCLPVCYDTGAHCMLWGRMEWGGGRGCYTPVVE